MKLIVKDIKGASQGDLELNFPLIEDGRGTQAVHDTVVAYMAGQRMGTACTKNVGEVNGTNKKPWRQKGTGRARAGSFASPLWRGGGVVFGPKPRDFSKKVNNSTRRLALRKALSERLTAGDVVVVDEIKLASPRTKEFNGVLAALELTGSVLLVNVTPDSDLTRASGNVSNVELTTSDSLHTYQVLKYDKLVFTKAALEKVTERLTGN